MLQISALQALFYGILAALYMLLLRKAGWSGCSKVLCKLGVVNLRNARVAHTRGCSDSQSTIHYHVSHTSIALWTILYIWMQHAACHIGVVGQKQRRFV